MKFNKVQVKIEFPLPFLMDDNQMLSFINLMQPFFTEQMARSGGRVTEMQPLADGIETEEEKHARISNSN
jgi:hypothetical protein